MIKTVYTDRSLINQILAQAPPTESELATAALLDDLGVTVCTSEEELAVVRTQISQHLLFRTLEAQGIDREPRPYIPHTAFQMERQGYRSVVAERLREEYETRVRERLERAARRTAVERSEQTAGPPAGKFQTLEEIRRQARESWLRLRQEFAESSAAGGPDRTRDKEHDPDDHYSH